MDSGIHKIFSMKTQYGHYYVQEMPGYGGIGRDFVVMRNRKQYVYKRYKDADTAIVDLMELVLHLFKSYKLDLN